MSQIKTLHRYRVDLAEGVTLAGPEKLVILVLKSNEDAGEFAVAISRVDAMLLSLQLSTAAASSGS